MQCCAGPQPVQQCHCQSDLCGATQSRCCLLQANLVCSVCGPARSVCSTVRESAHVHFFLVGSAATPLHQLQTSCLPQPQFPSRIHFFWQKKQIGSAAKFVCVCWGGPLFPTRACQKQTGSPSPTVSPIVRPEQRRRGRGSKATTCGTTVARSTLWDFDVTLAETGSHLELSRVQFLLNPLCLRLSTQH